MFDSAKRVMSGTWGQLWLDNELVAECYKFQAKTSWNKEEIRICGEMMTDTKTTGGKGTGSIGMYKINSRMAKVIGQKIINGEDVRFLLISKLDDPDAYGAERIAFKNVSFDDLTFADWESNVPGKIEAPFTFTKVEYLDMVDA